MKALYNDILTRIAETPLWYDSDGVPRYEPFHPDMCPDIYSGHVQLWRIACQYCGHEFEVEAHSSYPSAEPLSYGDGDPPRHDCPGGGETMSCDVIEVLQDWRRGTLTEWQRHNEYEGCQDE